MRETAKCEATQQYGICSAAADVFVKPQKDSGDRVKSLDTTDLKMNLNGWTSRQSQPAPTTTVQS